MDATTDPAETPQSLVTSALKLKAEIAAKQAELEPIETKLKALAPGKYAGNDGQIVQVVAGSPGTPGGVIYVWPGGEDQAAVLAQVRKLAGDKFNRVFDRIVKFTPCGSFREVVLKMLTPAAARDLLALCRRETAGSGAKPQYLRYPKAT